MASLQALKGFGAVCPFLHRVSPVGLRALSSTATAEGHNRLSLLATTACPMMSVALANRRAFATTTPAPAPAPTPAAPVVQAQTASPAATPKNARGYASIAEQQAESNKLQRAAAEDILARATAVSQATAADRKSVV